MAASRRNTLLGQHMFKVVQTMVEYAKLKHSRQTSMVSFMS